MALPMVAVVGRPNVGKSTLFNRLLGRPEAIVAPIPGTTRDRVVGQVTWEERPFLMVDTGGLEPEPQDPLRAEVKTQVEIAVAEADLIVFLTDVTDGLTPVDQDIAAWLRRTNKPVLLAVNKCDNEQRQTLASEFYTLGLGDPIPVSAYHNLGIYDFMERMLDMLPPPTEEPHAQEGVLSIAIVGRPNVGKSALLNAILGQPRAIVSEIPGTTRDVLDTPFTYEGQSMLLIDTAGIRRRGRVEVGIERYSVMRAIRAVQRAEITFLVLDAQEVATAQDTHILGLVYELFKGIVLVVNKWDLAQALALGQDQVVTRIRQAFHYVSYAPVVFTSALRKEGIEDLLRTGVEVFQERSRWVPHAALHRTVLEALGAHPAPTEGRRRLRIQRVLQGGINPPTFVFYVNYPDLVHFSYERYLENRLRQEFRFRYTHLHMVFKRQTEERQRA